ncbi:hypothetical protein Agub_g9624, partial [Astrephomene gubernaculifera]
MQHAVGVAAGNGCRPLTCEPRRGGMASLHRTCRQRLHSCVEYRKHNWMLIQLSRPRLCTALASFGPEPYDVDGPRGKRTRKPEWVRILEEDVDKDPDVARLMEGTGGDPEKIREKMRYALKDSDVHREGQGSAVPPRITFRAISPMGLWLWLEFLEPPLGSERELLEGVLKSWFAVGKLGGYNSQNLQVYHNADDDQSFFEYDNGQLEAGGERMTAYLHDMREVEYRECWARTWIDMGTADELSLDILLNMLVGFSTQMCGLRSIRLGGVNADWPVPSDEDMGLLPEDDYMRVAADPMRLPQGLDEEFQFMDEEGMLEGGKGGGGGAAGSGRQQRQQGAGGY